MPPSLASRGSIARIPCLHRSHPVPPSLASRASIARIPRLRGSYPVAPSLVSRASLPRIPSPWFVCRALAVAADRFRKGFLALLGKMPRLGGCGLAFELHKLAIDGSAHLAIRSVFKLRKSGFQVLLKFP